MTNADKSDLTVIIFIFFGSTYWDAGAVKRSTVWIRDEIIELFAFSCLCEDSQCSPRMWTETALLKHIMFASFQGYTFWSYFSELFTHTHIQYTMHAHTTARKHSVPGQSASNSLELKHSPLSQCGVACAGSVPVVSSFRARDILQQSSFCDAAVSLRGPDRQCSKDDSLGMSAQEQVETIDSTPGTNYEWTPRACSKETAACLSLLQTSYNPRQGIAVS